MAKLMSVNLEANEENSDAVAVTLYFDTKPTNDEVKAACHEQRGVLELSVNPEDKFFNWRVYPSPLSEKAGWVRVQAFPCG